VIRNFVVLSLLVSVGLFYMYGRSVWFPVYLKMTGKRTVADVVQEYGMGAEQRLVRYFETAGVAYPPEKMILVAFKDTKKLELWAQHGQAKTLVHCYEIQAASGLLGPKLKEGDKQVPEGMYEIIGLNPNSAYHLSMKLNYPNPFDLVHAKADGRDSPGTNIFIHGKSASVGCLAMGDIAIEELFTLTHQIGFNNVSVVISPTDPMLGELVVPTGSSEWVSELYKTISAQLSLIRNN
jgi:hypothetical protein